VAGLRLSDWTLTPDERAEHVTSELQTLMSRMSPNAREIFKTLAIKQAEAPKVGAEIYTLDYLYPPVKIQQFIEDPYYLGSILHCNIFPKLMDDLIELFDGSYSEVLLMGAIGWGKSVMAEIGIAYDIYRVSCLRSPADAYGLLPNSSLVFLNVSVRKLQAQKVLFSGSAISFETHRTSVKGFPLTRRL
jgi:hypothetical protein